MGEARAAPDGGILTLSTSEKSGRQREMKSVEEERKVSGGGGEKEEEKGCGRTD